MKNYLLPGIILVLALAAGGMKNSLDNDPLKERHPLNRARFAKVKASSARLMRASEVKGKNYMLYAPPVWPRWIPGYALDSSPITQWATNKGPQRIELDFGNRLAEKVLISEVRINWGRDRAREFQLMVSRDGATWKRAGRALENKRKSTFKFSPGLETRCLRLELNKGSGKGFSIKDIEVYGPDPAGTPILPVVKNLEAKAQGNDSIKITWPLPDGEGLYQFKVYRSTRPGFEPGPANLIVRVDETSLLDLGLDPDTTYYYTVTSENFSGRESEFFSTASATTSQEPLFMRMPVRGVIEGFYNDPWPHQERLNLIAFMEDVHLNHYLYAPKDEPYHRQLWREPYPAEGLANFRELVLACHAHRVTFNYGISPGLDINYNNPEEIKTLKARLKTLFDIGVRAFTLALDDIPGSGKADARMASDQVKVVNEIHTWLKGLDPETQLFFCPTVYSRTYSHWKKEKPARAEYLEEIANIDHEVLIFWTGPSDVFSGTIDLASAQDLQKIWNRKVLVWDNYPVNDVGLRYNMFLGPYIGRDLDLGQAVAGIFCNPMYLANANQVPLYTVGKYYTDPEYEPWRAYDEALRFVAGDKGYAPLKTLADTLLCHPKFPDRTVDVLPLKKTIDEFWKAMEQGSADQREECDKRLREIFKAFERNPEELEANLDKFQLIQELMPASEKLSIYGRAGSACLDFLSTTDPKEKAKLKREIKSLRDKARKNPWHVADNSMGQIYTFLYKTKQSKAIMEKFIERTLKNNQAPS
jgi:hyaluronoglucosaminidase